MLASTMREKLAERTRKHGTKLRSRMGPATGSRRVPKATEEKAATRRGTRAGILLARAWSPMSHRNKPTFSGGFGREQTRRGRSGIHHLHTGVIFQAKINTSSAYSKGKPQLLQ
jgi:hypothetical protein